MPRKRQKLPKTTLDEVHDAQNENRWDDAVHLAQQAEEYAKAESDVDSLAISIAYQAELRLGHAKVAELRRLAKRAAKLTDKGCSPIARTTVFLKLGYVYAGIGDIDQAIEQAYGAIEEARNLGDSRKECRSYILFSQINAVRGEHQNALAFVREAMSIAERSGQIELQLSLILRRARIYRQMGNYSTALDDLDKAEALAAEHGFKKHNGGIMLTRAFIYRSIGDHDRARKMRSKAIESASSGFAQVSLQEIVADNVGVMLGGAFYTKTLKYLYSLEKELTAWRGSSFSLFLDVTIATALNAKGQNQAALKRLWHVFSFVSSDSEDHYDEFCDAVRQLSIALEGLGQNDHVKKLVSFLDKLLDVQRREFAHGTARTLAKTRLLEEVTRYIDFVRYDLRNLPGRVFKVGGLRVNLENGEFLIDGKKRGKLVRNRLPIFALLVRHKNRLVTYDQILSKCGDDASAILSKKERARYYVSAIRKQLEHKVKIEPVTNKGYRLLAK